MVRLAVLTDRDFIYQLYMHPEVNKYLLYEPMDQHSFVPIFDDLVKRGVKFIYSNHDEPVGMFKLAPMTHRSSHIVYLGGLAIHPKWSGKGQGKNMMQEIISYCKHQDFLRIELSTAVINEKAIALYEKAGFQKEGILRKYTHLEDGNQFLDEVLMSYIFP